MTDTVSKEVRSRIMSKIRSKWTLPEKFVHNHLKGWKIRHRMHPDLVGHPDVLFEGTRFEKVVLFVDGCFWHGHGHCRIPDTEFWRKKISDNKKRDRKNRRALRKLGYCVLRVWECELSCERLWNLVCKNIVF